MAMSEAGDAAMSERVAEIHRSWRTRPDGDQIPCPALLCFYNHGLLNPDPQGMVTVAELDQALATVGVAAAIRGRLTKGADETEGTPEKFNLFALRDSKLDHTGSTGIRDPHVDPAKLDEALLRHAENGRMYARHFAAAANAGRQADPGWKGTVLQTGEFTAILQVFGRLDESGDRYLTEADLKSLWIEGRFPAGWVPRPVEDIGLTSVLTGVGSMLTHRVRQRIGL